MSKPYHYVRFKWWGGYDVKYLAKELEDFEVEELELPENTHDISLHKDERSEIKVKADTLMAFLAPARAVLYQKEPASFTEKDMKLREKILKLYPRDRPTPFPWEFSTEPKFEVVK